VAQRRSIWSVPDLETLPKDRGYRFEDYTDEERRRIFLGEAPGHVKKRKPPPSSGEELQMPPPPPSPDLFKPSPLATAPESPEQITALSKLMDWLRAEQGK
jgi:hypothetical protein